MRSKVDSYKMFPACYDNVFTRTIATFIKKIYIFIETCSFFSLRTIYVVLLVITTICTDAQLKLNFKRFILIF